MVLLIYITSTVVVEVILLLDLVDFLSVNNIHFLEPGPPTGFWGPRALTKNEALDQTRDYCVKHNQHISCYYQERI